MPDILTGLAVILASLIALVWFASVTFVAWLGWQAAVGNPRVIADEPGEDADWLADYDDFGIVADVIAEAEAYVRRAEL